MRADVVRMANQIAAQFGRQPEPAAAVAVAEHINTFWERRMRRELLALAASGDPTLAPVVRAAAERLRAAANP
jgi:formate dehydrogenase subunit delta